MRLVLCLAVWRNMGCDNYILFKSSQFSWLQSTKFDNKNSLLGDIVIYIFPILFLNYQNVSLKKKKKMGRFFALISFLLKPMLIIIIWLHLGYLNLRSSVKLFFWDINFSRMLRLTWKAIHFHIKTQCLFCLGKRLMHRVIIKCKSTTKFISCCKIQNVW